MLWLLRSCLFRRHLSPDVWSEIDVGSQGKIGESESYTICNFLVIFCPEFPREEQLNGFPCCLFEALLKVIICGEWIVTLSFFWEEWTKCLVFPAFEHMIYRGDAVTQLPGTHCTDRTRWQRWGDETSRLGYHFCLAQSKKCQVTGFILEPFKMFLPGAAEYVF